MNTIKVLELMSLVDSSVVFEGQFHTINFVAVPSKDFKDNN